MGRNCIDDRSPYIKVCLILSDRTKQYARVHRSDIHPGQVVEPPKKKKRTFNGAVFLSMLDVSCVMHCNCNQLANGIYYGSTMDILLHHIYRTVVF